MNAYSAAEDCADIAAFDRAKQALESCEDELVPDSVAARLLAGEHPLRVWREHRGLTQTALSETADIPQNMISAIESGRRQPSLATLRALAGGLGLDLDDLEPVAF